MAQLRRILELPLTIPIYGTIPDADKIATSMRTFLLVSLTGPRF
jgi:hypothetical protein